jgi:hypothetical protein
MALHELPALVVDLIAAAALRALTWLIALYGDEERSERPMRLLRRPPLLGIEARRVKGRHAKK